MNCLRPLSIVGVPEEKADDCMRWAFGDSWAIEPIRRWPDNWNKQYSDIFTVQGSDDFNISLRKIGREYLKTLEAKS